MAFFAFEIPEPSYEALFNEWVKKNPGSYIPLLARGYYFEEMGWHKRGTKFARKTSASQFEQLHYYHTKAMEDINNTISIKPRLSILYAKKIDIAKGLSDDAEKLSALSDGLTIIPVSYEIRKSYLYSILPRWGGII